MESISLIKTDQKDLSRRFKSVKKDIKSGKLKIKDEPVKKRKFTRKLYPAIYIGHIPHGFYENEMKSYFSQFGKVINTAVARSNKTGRSKGYGFVEFENCDVAQIAADTMNNYLMFNKILKCSYIPPENRRSNLKETPENQYLLRKINKNKNKKKRNSAVNNINPETYREKVQQKIDKFKKFFEDKGINFNLKLGDSSSSTDTVQKSESTESKTSKSSAMENVEDEFGVLEVGESDSDIYFKTPPQVRKVFKKSINSSVSSEKKLLENKKSKSKIVKANVRKENSSKIVKLKKSTNKTKTSGPKLLLVKPHQKSIEKKKKAQKKGIAQKLEENNNPKKKSSLAKSFKAKKNEKEKVKSLQKGVAAMLKEEKIKSISNAMSKLTGKAKVSVKKMKKK